MARRARPVRVARKNQLTAATHPPATTAAASLSGETGTPPMTSGSRGTGGAILPERPAKASEVEPCKRLPSPMVAMINDINGWPVNGRRIARLTATPTATMPRHAAPRAPASPSPSGWRPAATMREASTMNSPTAKLATREAL